MPQPNFSAVCYDLPTISRFFRSVALSVAFQRHISLRWETYRDSGVLNAVYKVMFWKEPPGNATVDIGSDMAIVAMTDSLHEKYLTGWLNRLHDAGPAAGIAYVQEMVVMREVARGAVQDIFRDASIVNHEVLQETSDAIATLAKIKLGATIGVAVIGGAVGIAYAAAALSGGVAAGGLTMLGISAGAPGLAFGATSFAYSATNSVISTWEDSKSATAVGVLTETGKAGGGTALDKAGEHIT